MRHSDGVWRHPIIKVVLLVYLGWGAWNWLSDRPVHPQDGILASADPQQVDVQDGPKLSVGQWTLTVRAHYQITARVLARERYHFDRLSDLIPEDLALGWGPMSDNRVLRNVDISQSNRFYYWSEPRHADITKELVITHSANTHVIPATSLTRKQLARLRPGQVVTLTGELVDGVRNDGTWIHTSLTRTDTGAGACEVLWVTDVSP